MTTSTSRSMGLAARLFLAMAAVVVAGGLTLLIVALIVAPNTFHRHLEMAGGPSSVLQKHVDAAFGQAMFVSLTVGVSVAIVTALLVTWFVVRRVVQPVQQVAHAAGRVADGDLDVRVPDPELGPEFEELSTSFNRMAARLAETEHTRRRLMSDLSHELRNPLASLRATIDATADGIIPNDEHTLTTLSEQTSRLQYLVQDLTRVSRAEEGQLDLHTERLDMRTIVLDAADHIRARYDAARRHLVIALPDESPIVIADADRLAEVLGNLLENALRHSPEDSTVTIALRADSTDVFVDVIDHGDGFEPSEADHLFERFYRGDQARRREQAGSGIGLTIARAIAQAHGGTLTAHSDGPGEGAIFTLSLPAAH